MTSLAQLILPDARIVELHGSCTLGRSAANTVALANDHISRKHAVIQFQGEGEFWLVDLGSSNGTYVNDRRVSRPLALKNGDVIDMAGSRIEFRTSAAPPAAAGADGSTAGATLLTYANRNCWLMVGDIVGATRLAQQLPPEEVPQVTGGWFKRCREVIEDQSGHMNQYLGDGFLCYWEATVTARQQVLAAMRALAEMQEAGSPPFRVVLHYGKTGLGSVPTMTDLNLHGPTVNFVFRMEKIAAALKDSRLCSEAAWEMLGVPALATRTSEVAGYDGDFRFYVPDLAE